MPRKPRPIRLHAAPVQAGDVVQRVARASAVLGRIAARVDATRAAAVTVAPPRTAVTDGNEEVRRVA